MYQPGRPTFDTGQMSGGPRYGLVGRRPHLLGGTHWYWSKCCWLVLHGPRASQPGDTAFVVLSRCAWCIAWDLPHTVNQDDLGDVLWSRKALLECVYFTSNCIYSRALLWLRHALITALALWTKSHKRWSILLPDLPDLQTTRPLDLRCCPNHNTIVIWQFCCCTKEVLDSE